MDVYWCAGVQGHVDRKEEALPEPHLPGFHVQDKHLRDGILGQRGLVSILTSIRHAMIQTHGCWTVPPFVLLFVRVLVLVPLIVVKQFFVGVPADVVGYLQYM